MKASPKRIMSLRFWRSSWMAPVGARLTPLVQLVAHAVSGGAVEYEAVGDDPQFRVDPDYGIHALAPGWYVMDIVLRVSEGDIQRPCLYPDYGGGCSEATRISLPQPDAAGRIHALVLISTPLRALRFDPSIRPTRFELGAMTFRRVTRARAVDPAAGAGTRPSRHGACVAGTPGAPGGLRRKRSTARAQACGRRTGTSLLRRFPPCFWRLSVVARPL